MQPDFIHNAAPSYVRVALATPLRRHFDYLPNASLPTVGARVEVPFGSRTLLGVVVALVSETDVPADKLKPIIRIVDQQPVLSNDIIKLCQWAAKYYHHSEGETLLQALPKALRDGKPAQLACETFYFCSQPLTEAVAHSLQRSKKQWEALRAVHQAEGGISESALKKQFSAAVISGLLQKGLIHSETRQPELTPFDSYPLLRQSHLNLNLEQRTAVEAISDELGHFRTFLLDGVTGSGKTEVYLQAIEQALAKGLQTLVLIPEIGLSPQTVKRFEDRFHTPVARLHSGLNDSERLQGWLDCRDGRAGILITTRSGIFTPLPKLGLIIVDEEHDTSYKQQDSLRYNARDLAMIRAQYNGCPVVLGSATPSLETLYNAEQKKYLTLRLTQRAGGAKPPQMTLLDMRHQELHDGLSSELLQRMHNHLNRGNQVLVFLNRRGYAPTLICQTCGHTCDCPHCDAQLTIHRTPPHLHCHHCDYQQAIPYQCPSCHSRKLEPSGHGTERTEQTLERFFHNFPIIRIDRDSTRRKNALDELLQTVHRGEPCILVGTQMLAKGHHFPDVTLVAIVNADGGFFSGDFRGAERTGQLIMQVAGRAGRAQKPGEVMIQSFNPQHPSLQLLTLNDYPRFAHSLLQERQQLRLPPVGHLTLIRTESAEQREAEALLIGLRRAAEPFTGITVLGPLPAPMERKQNRWRQHLLIRSDERRAMHAVVNHLVCQLEQLKLPRTLRWTVDIDPQDMS